jgi:hypothetical protein
MSEMSLPATTFAERGFSVGEAMNTSITMLSRNLLPFSIVTAVAALPQVLLFDQYSHHVDKASSDFAMIMAGALSSVVLGALSQAVVLHGAFESMRGGRPDLLASFQHASRRLLPVIAVALLTSFLAGLAFLLLIFPAYMLITAWYVATPACVAERIGPWQSLRRSAALTDGHRWKLFGIMIVLAIIGGVADGVVGGVTHGAGGTIGMVAKLIWYTFFDAYSAILVVVIYHDLRVAKEGVDTDQIAAVFE